MGTYKENIGHDLLFHSMAKDPITLNDLPGVTEEEKRSVDRMTFSLHEGDVMNIEPSCECGQTTREYNIGVICPNCRTPVVDGIIEELKPLVWFRRPEGVAKLINPDLLGMISAYFTKSKFNYLEWICNPSYNDMKGTRVRDLGLLADAGIQRGYNNFVNNFDKYMDILFNCKIFKDKNNDSNSVRELIQKNKQYLFSDYIPLPNKALLIVEQSKSAVYVDRNIAGMIDAIKAMRSIDTPLSGLSLRQKENRTAKVLFQCFRFYEDFYGEFLASKGGAFRKHVFGSRNGFSIRAVITSNTKRHQYDELHLPWAAAVTCLKLHIANKLMRRGYTINDIEQITQAVVYKPSPDNPLLVSWHKLIREVFDELLAESRDKCLWGYWN
jgi:hypothetical protein